MIADSVNQELVEHWRSGEVLQIDGIAFPSGVVTLVKSFTVQAGATVRCVAQPLADTSIESILKYDQSIWVPVTRLATLPWSPTANVVCGEGPMGNEGFVAATTSNDDSPIWILFSSHSNPFTAISRDADTIVLEAGYGQEWHIPFSDPTRFSIVDG